MKFDIVTIFPRMFEAPLAEGVVARGVESGAHRRGGARPARLHDRPAPHRRRRAVWRRAGDGDEARAAVPRGRAISARRAGSRAAVLLTSPQGRPFTQAEAARLAAARARRAAVRPLRGHRRAGAGARGDRGDLDRRLRAERRRAGGAGHRRRGEPAGAGRRGRRSGRSTADSFSRGLLDYPHYTRPAEFRGWTVPDVLLSGHHREIARWRGGEALRRTLARGRSCWRMRRSTRTSGACYES